ncbi:GlxA family transcriptional regulator [Desulfopila aestuarii]|uniref:Transcriptional regulator GlxA family, contains an amidase domain and an AraC-type DNA-binding HTH domain n=1 Tax=Desulfopila aestuarii DSM 18488 TaxID=1121416 RepID=A0A1M7YFH3_9BACT|nr:helix-turn-helix domain-containing protein [Desulfopila aestuarii]SHO51319.1 Transcriptional regulator GlxA family, contains an amidase domain and an AraC-type DNA-binding HTH domain [Desulfopila aestuarii DSM 18488]
MLTIALLAIQNAISSSITGPQDIFSVSNLQWQQMHNDSEPFCEVNIVQPSIAGTTSFNGLQIASTATIADNKTYDIIIIPAAYGDLQPTLHNQHLIGWLIRQHSSGACICCVCAGSFLIAKTGLLDNRRATTHWALANEFKQQFPKVILRAEKMLIDEGDIISSGGVTSYLDLCLYLVRRFGTPELATAISRTFLIDTTRQAQLPYATCSFYTQHGDAEILQAQQWLETHFSQPVTIAQLAGTAGLGERTFTRRFKKATGDSPSEYLQRIRIEAARESLTKTRETVDFITRAVGYEDVTSFRRLFRKYTGLSPSAYRKRFTLLYDEVKV